jgi:hypothetical protein
MRRFAAFRFAFACLVAAFLAHSVAAAPGSAHRTAKSAAAPAPAAGRNDPRQPPHAWLFGTWSGGLFPAPSGMSAEACLAQPVVIFTRDIVLRSSLTDQFYVQRLIETALTNPGGTQFRFTSVPAAAGLLAGGSAAGAGFGCGDPDSLVVERKSDNEITFPGCADFPNPLVRCRSR